MKNSQFLISLAKSAIITFLVFVCFFFFKDYGYSWNLQSATCLTEGFCHCEVHDLTLLFAESANVYSSLFYLFSGLLIFFISRKGGFKMEGNLFLLGSIAVSFGSIMYHATLSQLGLTLDFLGITIIMSVFYLSVCLRTGLKYRHVFIASFANLAVFIATFFYDQIGVVFLPQILVGLYGLVVILSEKDNFSFKNIDKSVYIILILYIFAYTMWWLGNIKEICAQSPFIHFHSLWHLGGASALFFLYVYIINTSRKNTKSS